MLSTHGMLDPKGSSAMHERYAVYILASRRNGTLYIGMTGDLVRRVAQHKSLAVPGFTRTHAVTRLVYVERYADVHEAIAREKQLKGWNRAWKIKLIERANSAWSDLDPTAC
jgi:putative endonuclease